MLRFAKSMPVGRTSRVTAHPRREIPYSGDWVDQGWHTEAACAGSGEDMITPEEPGRVIADYCRACPVIVACAEEGLRIDAQHGYQTYGIWGGVFVPFSNENRKKAVQALSDAYATLRMTDARSA